MLIVWLVILLESIVRSDNCYGITFDAGSSGTRLYIYRWQCRTSNNELIRFDRNFDFSPRTKSPGLHTYADRLDEVADYFSDFFETSRDVVPEEKQPFTPIMLAATAGFKLLNQESRQRLLRRVQEVLNQSGFLYHIDEWARVLSGREEGAYLWLSTNYLLRGFESDNLAGVIDLGGASTQISFGPQQEEEGSIRMYIPELGEYRIFSKSYVGFGNDVVRNKHIERMIGDDGVAYSACYNRGYVGVWMKNEEISVIGTGEPAECLSELREWVREEMQNRRVVSIPQYREGMEIYGYAGYSYGPSQLGLEQYSHDELLDRCNKWCEQPWDQIVDQDIPFQSRVCSQCLYITIILKDIFQLPNHQVIKVGQMIDGIVPSQTMAMLLFELQRIECHMDSPICR